MRGLRTGAQCPPCDRYRNPCRTHRGVLQRHPIALRRRERTARSDAVAALPRRCSGHSEPRWVLLRTLPIFESAGRDRPAFPPARVPAQPGYSTACDVKGFCRRCTRRGAPNAWPMVAACCMLQHDGAALREWRQSHRDRANVVEPRRCGQRRHNYKAHAHERTHTRACAHTRTYARTHTHTRARTPAAGRRRCTLPRGRAMRRCASFCSCGTQTRA